TDTSLVVIANTIFRRGLSCAPAGCGARPVRTLRSADVITIERTEVIDGSCDDADGSCADDLVRLGPEDHATLDRLHHEVQGDPEQGEQDHDGEDAGDVQADVELQDQVAESALRADELAYDV